MIEVINLEKLSNDGYKATQNDPNESTPPIILHTHSLGIIRFTSSYVIQGVSSNGFEFNV